MSNKKKNSKQNTYIVSITKKFEYPSCILDKNNYLRDAFQKSWEEFVRMFTANPNQFKEEMQCTVEKVPYKLPSSDNSELGFVRNRDTGNAANVSYILKQVAEYMVSQKYGVLNENENPSIYDEDIEEILDPEGNVVDKVYHRYLNQEVSDYYDDCYAELTNHISRLLI